MKRVVAALIVKTVKFWSASGLAIRRCRSSGSFPAAKLKKASSRAAGIGRWTKNLELTRLSETRPHASGTSTSSGNSVDLRFFVVREYRAK